MIRRTAQTESLCYNNEVFSIRNGITLMVCGGFVYAVGFDGFSVETATGGEVEAWLDAANGGGSSPSYTCNNEECGKYDSDTQKWPWVACPARTGSADCRDCTSQTTFCKSTCKHSHSKCHNKKNLVCPFVEKPRKQGCSGYGQTKCPSS